MAESSVGSQKTIAREGSVSGTGLHTGSPCEVFFKAAPENAGVRFYQGTRLLAVIGGSGEMEPRLPETPRSTSLGAEEACVRTVEHLLAAISAIGITNIEVRVNGPEIPALDGSAAPFVRLFRALGMEAQGEGNACPAYRPAEPVFCAEVGGPPQGRQAFGRAALALYPGQEGLHISYTLDYPSGAFRNVKAAFQVTPEAFERDIAPARTFCTEEEQRSARAAGLGLGATRENTLVLRQDGRVDGDLRFPDEFARHKVLDLIGDLGLLGFPVAGRVVGIRSGHALNRRLVRMIREQRREKRSS